MGKENRYSLKYNPHFDHDLDRLDSFWQKEVLRAIEEKLVFHPAVFGVPLRETLKGFWKLRVGDYRLVYRVQKNIVEILIVEHRSVVYWEAVKRLG